MMGNQGMMGQGMMGQGMMGQGMMGQGMMGQGMGMMTGANIQNDVQMLRTAMKGLGTDEKTIINIISHRSWYERQQIKMQYSSILGRDLIKDFKSELSGKLEDTVLALFDTPAEFDAKSLYKAMHGIGTDNEVLIEIIGTRSAYELQNIKNAFMQLYQKDLTSRVESETSGHFRKILVAILQCQRHDNTFMVDQGLCQSEATQLYQAGQGRWGTDEEVFTRIFAQKSSMELATIASFYQQMSGMSLYQAIEKEFSGNVKELLKAIFYAVINPPEFFATKIHECVSGVGTKDQQLIRIIISRAEIDMDQIKTAYYRLYNRDMLGDIRADTSSNYKKILTELVMK
jgi:annexin A7/11